MVNEDISSKEDFKIDCGIKWGWYSKQYLFHKYVYGYGYGYGGGYYTDSPQKKGFSLRNIFGK